MMSYVVQAPNEGGSVRLRRKARAPENFLAARTAVEKNHCTEMRFPEVIDLGLQLPPDFPGGSHTSNLTE